ncbi:MAG TPA: MauE/DoxX family redox-associated membrane protein [Bryobacteraceae bacterium]|nr:MauE/DoxX family redox-associated membrane protein [Bryobacteraceae bacterium]
MTSPSKILKIVLFLLRVGIGGVFVYAAWIKLREPWMLFAISIDAYHLLPEWAVTVVARTLPWVELAAGLLLIAGRWKRVSTVSVSALLALFFAMMVRAYARGEAIDCGCFGPGEAISPWTLLRDGSLLGGSLLLTVIAFRRPRKPEPLTAENLAESSYRPA